jgi:alginate O-acetyltransferase complex protein AlgI
MLFQTWEFALFFLLFYPVYLVLGLLRATRLKTAWLLLASYIFYASFNPLYVVLIIWATAVDYLAVAGMERSRHRRFFLALSIGNNLGLLGFFKYGAFVASNINLLLGKLDLPYEIAEPGFLFPVGISFYVFRSLSYTIDFYRGDVPRERNVLRYATFVAFFPELIAGPIDRATSLLPQLRRTTTVSRTDIADGLSLLIVGLFKKIALADYLAMYVDQVYATPATQQSPALLLASVAFAWQIYFDFSGYTDMARGIGRMMGLRLMLNFNNPYLASGLGDFWRRWHISLSTWFRDYVYIPLGGNRHGTFRIYVNMALTMLISGLWHGAAWTFVIWGAVHAAGYTLTRHLERTPFYRDRVPRQVKQALTFTIVTFAWIFFRADTFTDARLIVTRIFTAGWTDPRCPLVALAAIAAVWLYQLAYESRFRRIVALPPVRLGIVLVMLLIMAVMGSSGTRSFIYVQF